MQILRQGAGFRTRHTAKKSTFLNHFPYTLFLKSTIVTKLENHPGFCSALSCPWQLLQQSSGLSAQTGKQRGGNTQTSSILSHRWSHMLGPESPAPLLSPSPYHLSFMETPHFHKFSCCHHLLQHFSFQPTSHGSGSPMNETFTRG